MDGDDYWIDDHKLEKQVRFLKNNPAYNMCFSRHKVLKKGKEKRIVYLLPRKKSFLVHEIVHDKGFWNGLSPEKKLLKAAFGHRILMEEYSGAVREMLSKRFQSKLLALLEFYLEKQETEKFEAVINEIRMNDELKTKSKPFMPPREEYEARIRGIWQNARLTNNGPLVHELEEKLKDYLGLRYSSVVTNCTIGLQLAIRALELKGEIITTPFSYIASSSSIVWENCQPVFADIDPFTLNIDPATIEPLITKKGIPARSISLSCWPLIINLRSSTTPPMRLAPATKGNHCIVMGISAWRASMPPNYSIQAKEGHYSAGTTSWICG
jgi:hypothetical protein